MLGRMSSFNSMNLPAVGNGEIKNNENLSNNLDISESSEESVTETSSEDEQSGVSEDNNNKPVLDKIEEIKNSSGTVSKEEKIGSSQNLI